MLDHTIRRKSLVWFDFAKKHLFLFVFVDAPCFCKKYSSLNALSSFLEMEKVVGKRCPMCNNQKGMGAPPKPKPKVEGKKGQVTFQNGQQKEETVFERKREWNVWQQRRYLAIMLFSKDFHLLINCNSIDTWRCSFNLSRQLLARSAWHVRPAPLWFLQPKRFSWTWLVKKYQLVWLQKSIKNAN